MIELRQLQAAELVSARDLLARAMCDDPMHVAVFGPDAVHRRSRLERFFGALLPRMVQAPLSAWDDGRLVGVLGQFPPGTCCLPLRQQLSIALPLLTGHFRDLWRLWRWSRASKARDSKERHWHVGPMAVEVGRQRQGIGSLLLQAFCLRMDRQGETAFLETDKLDSVRFYSRCGFEVAAHDKVLSTPNWWMRRLAGPVKEGGSCVSSSALAEGR